jgi:rhamnosyltransferase
MLNKKLEKESVIAVVVTFNPKIELFNKVINSLIKQVLKIIIVDNGSSNILNFEHIENEKINLIRLHENTGIGTALNIGIRYAKKYRPNYILALDQDTIIYENAINKVLDSYNHLSEEIKGKVGIICLNHNIVADKNDFTPVKFAITSGNLISEKVYNKIQFREDFFIDQVDFEFDLNVINGGYTILRYNKKLMDHIIGIKSDKGKNFEPIWRVYYIARNSTFLVTRYDFGFSAYISQLVHTYIRTLSQTGLKNIFKLSFFTAKGVVDGLMGKLGKVYFPNFIR